MGESIAEATILKWLKGVGDKVEKNETILEISTDKVDSEIPSPASGVIVEIKAKEGEVVPVKSVIAIIGAESDVRTVETTATTKPQEQPQAVAQPVAQPQTPPPVQATQQTVHAESLSGGDRFLSPLVRSLAVQYGVSAAELSNIVGTGANGRISKNDILEFIDQRDSGPAPQVTQVRVQEAAPQRAQAEVPARAPTASYGSEGVRVEPFDRMRKIIAEHMVRSKATSPHVYTMAECDVTTISKWREKNQSAFFAREGYKLSFTPFFLEAAIKALVQFPQVNASVDGETLVIKKNVNLGCAVALGSTGLIVPVIKNADQLSFSGISRNLQDLATRARDKKLSPDEIQGGTFTVTNPGIFGSIMGCPIINQPQLAILAVGAIKKRPVVVNDAIAVRDMVYLTLSYDHRVIDGSLGGQFLQFIVKHLENWDINRELF